jgi:hypothetical protein
MTKQVLFLDLEGCAHAGLLLDDGYIVCGCCGSLVEPDEYLLLHVYKNWVDIEEEICGDDLLLKDFQKKVNTLSTKEMEKILCTMDATNLLKSLNK